MDKIIPYSFHVEFKVSSLGMTINSKEEISEFQKMEYIKEVVKENINPSPDFVNLNKIGNIAIGVHEEAEIEKRGEEEIIFLKFKVGRGSTKGLVVDQKGKIEYKIGLEQITLEDFFVFLQFNSKIENNILTLYGSVYLLHKGGQGLKRDFEDFFRNIIFSKKPDLIRFEAYLTKKELDNLTEDLIELEFEGEFSKKNKFYNDKNLDIESRRKLKTGLFLKTALKAESTKRVIIDSIKNQNLEKIFAKKPKGTVSLNINGTIKRRDFDVDTLLVTIKDDIVSSRKVIEYITFKNDCKNYFFKLGSSIGAIQ